MQRLLLLVLLFNLQTVSTANAAQPEELVECAICFSTLTEPAQPKGCTCTTKLCCVDCFSTATFTQEQPKCPLCKQPCKFHFRSFELTPEERATPPQEFFLFIDDQQTVGLNGDKLRWSLMISRYAPTAFIASPHDRSQHVQLSRRVMKRFLQVAERNGRTTLKEFGKNNPFILEVANDLRLHAQHNEADIAKLIEELDKDPIQRPPTDEERLLMDLLRNSCNQQ